MYTVDFEEKQEDPKDVLNLSHSHKIESIGNGTEGN